MKDVSTDVKDVEDLSQTFPDLEQQLQVSVHHAASYSSTDAFVCSTAHKRMNTAENSQS